MMTRKVVQIAYGTAMTSDSESFSSSEQLFALTDDGIIFVLNRPSEPRSTLHIWEEVAPIPQD